MVAIIVLLEKKEEVVKLLILEQLNLNLNECKIIEKFAQMFNLKNKSMQYIYNVVYN